MRGLGTIINTLAVILGAFIGMQVKNGLSEKMQNTLMKGCGISTLFIGAAGAFSYMFSVGEGGKLETSGSMLLILSLVLGGLIGELIDVEGKMEILGEKIKKAAKVKNDNTFVEAFVNVSLIICVGAMAIVGSIQDGISGDYSMLAIKAVLDMVLVMVFASSYGIGAAFSAIPILVYQGSITLLAMFFGSFVTQDIIDVLSYVGSVLIFCVGINVCFGKKVSVGNMLPALIVAVIARIICVHFGIHL